MTDHITDSSADARPENRREKQGDKRERHRRCLPRLKLSLLGLVVLLALALPLWAPRLLRSTAFFHVKRVEILGARYVPPAELLARLHVDTTASVWAALDPLAARVAAHPGVESVRVRRKLPGTLVVEVVERTPVALLPGADGFRVYDERGVVLPVDPAHAPVDAPIIDRPDPAVLKLLGGLRQELPSLYDRISVVRQVGGNELLMDLKTVAVRAMKNVPLKRFIDIDPVENDLTKRHLRASEIDLRYRDQVIARLP